MAEKRQNKPGNPADRLGETAKSHGPLGQGYSDVQPASQNLSGMGKSQAPASGTGNSTSAASPSGPRPLQEQREAGNFGPDGIQGGIQSSGNQSPASPNETGVRPSKAKPNPGGRANSR
jgi:hypothetical protein